jgi:hypothetical protein
MSVYTAVIVEPRKHPALSFVLHNVVANLSADWSILIFHGKENRDYVEQIISTMKEPSRFLKPIQLDIDNLSVEQYNAVLMNHAFYRCIPTETILIFQTDTLILEPSKLHDFLEYDYVGAPWKSGQVGNGGLSLRKKSKMLSIATTVNPFHVNEDMYFSMQKVVPLKKPTFQEAKRFAVETVFYEAPFGIHAPWKHLKEEEMRTLKEKYPVIQELIRLLF